MATEELTATFVVVVEHANGNVIECDYTLDASEVELRGIMPSAQAMLMWNIVGITQPELKSISSVEDWQNRLFERLNQQSDAYRLGDRMGLTDSTLLKETALQFDYCKVAARNLRKVLIMHEQRTPKGLQELVQSVFPEARLDKGGMSIWYKDETPGVYNPSLQVLIDQHTTGELDVRLIVEYHLDDPELGVQTKWYCLGSDNVSPDVDSIRAAVRAAQETLLKGRWLKPGKIQQLLEGDLCG